MNSFILLLLSSTSVLVSLISENVLPMDASVLRKSLSESYTSLSRTFSGNFLSDGFIGNSNGYKWLMGLLIIFWLGNCSSADHILESLLVINHIVLPIFQALLGKLSSFNITIPPSIGSV